MAYAEVADLELLWRSLSEDEKKRAAALLDAAAVILDGELARCHVKADELKDQLKYVSCEMVRRKMQAGDYGDVSSVSRTAGSFTEQISPYNPSGDMYLTSSERRLLGIQLKRGRIKQVRLA